MTLSTFAPITILQLPDKASTTRQHDVVPELSLVSDITHVALAFMHSSTFNELDVSDWPLFTTVEQVRPKFANGTKVMVAIGGWGDTAGFSRAAATDSSRKLFAQNVKAMLEHTGADGESMSVDLLNVADANRSRGGHRLGISWVSGSLLLRISHLVGQSHRIIAEMERTTSRSRTKRKPGKSKPIPSCCQRFAPP